MSHSDANESKDKLAEAAWDKLQKQLEQEPVNTQWVRWAKQANEKKMAEATEAMDAGSMEALAEANEASLKTGIFNATAFSQSKETVSSKEAASNWMKRNSKWLTGALAASVLAVALFTPVGNKALASILNKFRMEQVTVVQENEIQQMMNGFFADGESREAINKFGSFTQTSSTTNGEYTLKDAEKLFNRKINIPKDFELQDNKLYISSKNEVTFNLHVAEVNKVLQSLGAKKLLPQSIDGKPIKLIFGESINVSKQVKLGDLEAHYSFSQMAAPTLEIDPSISVEEALDAVLNFPFLPDHLKNDIKNSSALTGGSLPLPIFTNGTSEKHTVKGVEVVMVKQVYKVKDNKGNTIDNSYYGVTWVKNGQLYNLNGNGFTDENAVFAKAEELIVQ
jgi:hypothetical protein